MASRLSQTGHENRLSNQLAAYGLTANIPISYVDIGLKVKHPVHQLKDLVQTLDTRGKLDMLLMGNTGASLEQFWGEFRKHQPDHPIYDLHRGREGQCLPMMLHFDEGSTLKKRQIMIVQLQPLLGRGTRKRKGSLEVPGCNFLGNSLTTRFLYSVMLARLYGGKFKNKPLQRLVDHLAADLARCFREGVEVSTRGGTERLFLVPLGCKGDWPALVKVGSLTRHFGRKAAKNSKGICHLCKADQEGHKSWHILGYNHMQNMRAGVPLPWAREPSIVAAVPLTDADKAQFFKIDPFHTLHKGVMGDLAANAIVFRLIVFAPGVIVDSSPDRVICNLQVCCLDAGLFGNQAFDALCLNFFAELKPFCAARSLQLHMTSLSRTLLGFPKASEYPSGSLSCHMSRFSWVFCSFRS